MQPAWLLCAGRTSVQYASQMSSQCYQAFKCMLWSEVRWGAPIYSGSELILQSLTIIEYIKVSTIQPITLQNESSYRICAAAGSTVADLFAALCCMNWVRRWSYHVLFSSLLGWRCWSCCGNAGVLLMAAYLTCLPKMMQSINNFTQNYFDHTGDEPEISEPDINSLPASFTSVCFLLASLTSHGLSIHVYCAATAVDFGEVLTHVVHYIVVVEILYEKTGLHFFPLISLYSWYYHELLISIRYPTGVN